MAPLARLERRALALLACVVALFVVPTASAGPPAGFSLETVASGLEQPTAFAHAPDGRIFVAEKPGRVRIVSGGTVVATFIDLRAQTNSHLDRGLIGLALDPDFARNRRVYLAFTEELRPDDPDRAHAAGGRLIRVAASAANLNLADAATRTDLVTGFESQGETHSVGGLRFDPQGRLLMTMGDGSDHLTVDPRALRSYDLDHPNGKLLRVDPETGNGVPGNPYYDPLRPGAHRSRVLARGLRNPFRFQVDPATGRIYIGDVGWSTWEEINLVEPTSADPDVERNFGWPCYEGGAMSSGGFASVQQNGYNFLSACADLFPPSDSPVAGTGRGARAPLYAYRHTPGVIETDAAVVAGPVYPGGSYGAAFAGRLFFGDYARDSLSTRAPDGTVRPFGSPGGYGGPVDIGLGPGGDLFYAAIGLGEIRRIVGPGGNRPPIVRAGAAPRAGKRPLRVQFSAFGTRDPDGDRLTYRWSFGDGRGSSGANPVHTYTRRGTFTARLTVSDGRPDGSVTRAVKINVDNTAPRIAVRRTGPARYRVGSRIRLRVRASDAETGPVAARRIRWRVVLRHANHIHFFRAGRGRVVSLRVPDHGDDSRFEIRITASDGDGASRSRTIILRPRTVPLRITSNIPRLDGGLDGERRRLPTRVASIVGGAHVANAPPEVGRAGGLFILDHWRTDACNSSGGTLRFRTAPSAMALRAVYRRAGAARRDRRPPCVVGVRAAADRRGARVAFRVSERAGVSIRIARVRRARVGGRVVVRTPTVRRLPTRIHRQGRHRRSLGPLARGRYRIFLTAVDPAGNRRGVSRDLLVRR